VAFIAQSVVRNPAVQWSTVGQYLFNHSILIGVLTTLKLTALSMSIALVLAVVIAVARLTNNLVLQWMGYAYIWLFRSLPLLVLLLVTFNISLFYRHFALGIPFGPTFFAINSEQLISALVAAVIALALHEAAYSSEILRAAINAVPRGERDAARALGMRDLQIYRRIVLPQAFRLAIPPLANDTISMVKNTALVAFIAVPDLMYTAQSIYATTYEVVPLLVVASLWYLAIISVLTIVQSILEGHFERRGRGVLRRQNLIGIEEHA
jgi:polar amino acid transport system permease protein